MYHSLLCPSAHDQHWLLLRRTQQAELVNTRRFSGSAVSSAAVALQPIADPLYSLRYKVWIRILAILLLFVGWWLHLDRACVFVVTLRFWTGVTIHLYRVVATAYIKLATI